MRQILIVALILGACGRLAAEAINDTVTPPQGAAIVSDTGWQICGNTESRTWCWAYPIPGKSDCTCTICPDTTTSTSTTASYGEKICATEHRSLSGSIIDNLAYQHHHIATDYFPDLTAFTDPGQGCAPCGGAAASAPIDDLPTLTLQRRHRFRDVVYDSSFGPGVFGTYDTKLYLRTDENGETLIDLFDPRQPARQRFVDGPWTNPWGYADAKDGIYRDPRSNSARELCLTDAAGTLVTDQAAATRAELHYWTGEVATFQIIDVDGGRAGRLVRLADRNDYAMTLTYHVAPGDDLQGSLARQWQIATITDAHQRTASFTYASAQVGGRWVVERIDLPGGQAIHYGYAGDGFLASVDLPDGTRSTFDRAYDPVSRCIVVTMFEAAAEAEHRAKRVYLTTNFTVLPSVGDFAYPQSAQLVRMVVNGEDEVAYLNIPHPQYTEGYVYEGRHRLRQVGYDWFSRYARSWSIERGEGEPWSWHSVHADLEPTFDHQDYDAGNHYRTWYRMEPHTDTDEFGVRRSLAYNEASRFTEVIYDDGTRERFQLNAFQQVTQSIDRLGRVTRWTYDQHGNTLSRTAGLQWNGIDAVPTPALATWRWTYHPAGHPHQYRMASAIDANGNETRFGYTPEHLLAEIVEPADLPGGVQAITRFAYDAAGRRVAVTDADGRLVTFAYDARNRLNETRYPDGSAETVAYGAGIDANLVVARGDRNGRVERCAFDRAGRDIRCVRADGVPTPLVVETAYLTGTTLPVRIVDRGDARDHQYDYRHRLVAAITYPRAGVVLVTRTVFDDRNLPASRIDAYGRATYLRFDGNAQPVRLVRELVPGGVPAGTDLATLPRDFAANPAYVIEDRVFDAEGQETSVIGGRGLVSTTAYDAQGRAIAVVRGAGSADEARTETDYDAQGNLIEVREPRHFSEGGGFVTRMTWTARNLMTTRTIAVGRGADEAATTMLYTLTRKPETIIEPGGGVLRSIYGDCCDRLVESIDQRGAITRYTHDAVGNVIATTDANDLTSTRVLDGIDRPVLQVNGAGEATSLIYDEDLSDGLQIPGHPEFADAADGLGLVPGSDGSAVAVLDPLGQVTVEIHDGIGRAVRRVDALRHARTVIHDAVVDGLVETASVDPLGHVTRSRSDGNGIVRVQIDAEGQITRRAADANGNIVAERDANDVGFDAQFDALDRETARTDTYGLTSINVFDRDGNLVRSVDAAGVATESVFDPRGRRVATTDRVGATTAFRYSVDDDLVAIVDAEGGETRYAYDAAHLLVGETFPGPTGGTRTYAYDAGRRLVLRIDQAGVATTYAYDAANRLVKRGYSSGSAPDAYAYDPASRLVAATSGRYANRIERAYDAASRLVRERHVIAGAAYDVDYEHDDDDRVIELSHPGGQRAERSYTARDQLALVRFDGADVAARRYDPGMRLIETIYGNGRVETRAYRHDGARRDDLVATISTPGVSGFTYAYDDMRNKISELDHVVPASSQQFSYDAEQRLTGWTQGAGSPTPSKQAWDLSPVGDWRRTVRDGAIEDRTHTSVHEIATITAYGIAASLLHDAKGNLSRDERGALFGWDDENRLGSATISDVDEGISGMAAYEYDALGRRVRAHVWGVTTTFIHAGPQVIHEFDSAHVLSPEAADDDGAADASAQEPPGGGILPADQVLTRVNFQPLTTAIPSGFIADKGKSFAARTNAYAYGWDAPLSHAAIARGEHPFPQFDTFIGMQPAGERPGIWEFAVPNGTYPVILVMGDCASTEQTNDVAIEGVLHVDPDPSAPAGYERGDFDGYAAEVTVADGRLTIAVGDASLTPKLCFIEIGKAGATIDQATRDRLAVRIGGATARTGGEPWPRRRASPRRYVYGTYVDEPLALIRGSEIRSYYHANSLYSVAALTDATGAVIERYRYDAYGKRTVLSADGATVVPHSVVGNQIGFTGRHHDDETGLIHFRARQYSPTLGRFISRNAFEKAGGWAYSSSRAQKARLFLKSILKMNPGAEYIDGYNLYAAVFAARQQLDPSGEPSSVMTPQGAVVLGEAVVEAAGYATAAAWYGAVTARVLATLATIELLCKTSTGGFRGDKKWCCCMLLAMDKAVKAAQKAYDAVKHGIALDVIQDAKWELERHEIERDSVRKLCKSGISAPAVLACALSALLIMVIMSTRSAKHAV
ncbi:MAG TPA: RHS repeat-associated core domain-containing protein [Planctomycetota bacterium]|nr:RHS repeat-associated core domain-containing protein [Planctomycetota bacterium]